MTRYCSVITQIFALVAFTLMNGPLTPATAFPLFPNFSPALCSFADGPWYLCEQSENFDSESVQSFYVRIATFLSGGANGENAAAPGQEGGGILRNFLSGITNNNAEEVEVVTFEEGHGDGGTRKARQLRKGFPPKEE